VDQDQHRQGTAGTAGVDPAAADGTGTRTDGTQIAFTEARLKSVLQKCWTQGGKPGTIMLGGGNKQQFSTFTGRASPIEDTKSKKITASVTAYESDFGTLKVVPNRFMRTRDVLVLEMDKWACSPDGKPDCLYPRRPAIIKTVGASLWR
jgi:hypothetical protein